MTLEGGPGVAGGSLTNFPAAAPMQQMNGLQQDLQCIHSGRHVGMDYSNVLKRIQVTTPILRCKSIG